ncbi:hypothetical protein GCM10025868_13550 [Angustibacter aerolatus]|uniref:PAS domain-containing protein n=1 Tax=Angustibacter aerolatus TaxID=1162965 RepID=A0ABQ6JFW5_9ACTN|nr:SpoIIE family protein phosphatase [Angustibacter aerolatus]GMA86105.1 hypothetical protein GCM10025868_13550 [Angustibacter aerolatus]
MGFSIAGIVLVWGFFRFRLVDLVPVGRRQVFDRIPDGVLVLDLLGRVVDANPAAGRLAGRARGALVGAVAGEVLPALHPLLRSTAAGESATGSEVLPAADGVRRDVEVTISPLPDDASEPSGRLVVVRDVSAQRSVERRLRELVAERQTTIDTLQRGLVPARLPHVPGLDVAAALDPAEAETNVGGDFLDLRAVGDGRWACMIGDVVGKGAGAATLTALARHTAVALSGLGWVPSRVLAAVAAAVAAEEAVGDPDADPRFCTMALATLEPVPGGAEVVLSLGGHPRPFVVSASGSVTEVGRPGSLLGVVDPPRLHDELVRLRAGDALVLFTDGVTETRRGLEPFGDDQAGAPPRLARRALRRPRRPLARRGGAHLGRAARCGRWCRCGGRARRRGGARRGGARRLTCCRVATSGAPRGRRCPGSGRLGPVSGVRGVRRARRRARRGWAAGRRRARR